MNSKDLYLFDEHIDEICEMCEKYILGCSRMSYHFMCEGSRCEDAHEMFEESNEYLHIKREKIINKILEDE